MAAFLRFSHAASHRFFPAVARRAASTQGSTASVVCDSVPPVTNGIKALGLIAVLAGGYVCWVRARRACVCVGVNVVGA